MEMAKAIALDEQIGGSHYKDFTIQPLEFIEGNKLSFIEGNIVKYVCRYHNTKKPLDLEKIKHYADLLKELAQREDIKAIQDNWSKQDKVTVDHDGVLQ